MAEENNSIAKPFCNVIRPMRAPWAYLFMCEMMCYRHNVFVTTTLHDRGKAPVPAPAPRMVRMTVRENVGVVERMGPE